MYASKVSFSAQTKEMLTSPALSRMARAKLRRKRILEFIRETPNGEAHKYDLIAAAGFNPDDDSSYGRGWAIVRSLEKKGIIFATDGSDPKDRHLKQWTISADVKTRVTNNNGKMTVPKGDGKTTLKPADQTFPVVPTTFAPPKLEPTVPTTLEEQAKDFAWQMNSDSLRDFIAWTRR